MREILLRRRKSTHKLGFSIRGGKEHGIGFFVSDVEVGSEAYLQGLRTGDEIIRINGFSLRYAVHSDVIGLFKNAGKLCLSVRNAGILPIKDHKQDNITWKTVAVPVSPPIKKASINENIEMKLFLDMSNHQELGCTICKGPPERPGIFVHAVKEKSLASGIGLRPGDQIIIVNQQSFLDIDFQTAVKYLKAHKQLEMVITKGTGRELIAAESSGYNSSTSSLNGEINTDEQVKVNSQVIYESKQDENINFQNNEHLSKEINSLNTDNLISNKKNELYSNVEHSNEELNNSVSTIIPFTNINSEAIANSNILEEEAVEDKVDEDSVVEEIRKAAEEELRKHSWGKIDTNLHSNQEKPILKDQEVQTTDNYKSDITEHVADVNGNQINNQRSGHIWQRTVIAEVHNNPLPAPPPLPKENIEPKTKLGVGYKSAKADSHLHSKGITVNLPKMAEEIKKIAQHDQLIEEFKQVHKTMQNMLLESRSPVNGNTENDDVKQAGRLNSCIISTEVDNNNSFSIPRPKEIKSTRRGPLVTIGTYGDSDSHRMPNRFAFLNNIPKQNDALPKNKSFEKMSDKNNCTTYTTIIENGPEKSTAVIETGIIKNTVESRSISRFDENKVTIKVPAAEYHNGQPEINSQPVKRPEVKIGRKWDGTSNVLKHISNQDVPIIIEELPRT